MFGERKARLADLAEIRKSLVTATIRATKCESKFNASTNHKSDWYDLWMRWEKLKQKCISALKNRGFEYYCRYGRFPDDR